MTKDDPAKLNSKKKAKELAAQLKAEKELKEEKERVQAYHENKRKKTREQGLRRVLLQETKKYIENICRDVKNKENRIRKKVLWNKYVSCLEFPSPYKPSELREYLYRWKMLLANETDTTYNWILKINELSFVTQSYEQKDFTRKYLRLSQPTIGDKYSYRINEVLLILDELENVLERREKLSLNLITELNEIKINFREMIKNFIEIFIYNILRNIERDMEIVDAITSDFIYESIEFKTNIWTIRDVPLPPSFLKERTIQLPSLDGSIKVPPFIRFNDAALCALLLNYDHYSDSALTFKLQWDEKLDSNFTDLSVAVDSEWGKRAEMIENKLKELKQIRAEYEEKIKSQFVPVVEISDSKNKKKEKPKVTKKKKKVQQIVEPPKVNEDTFIDIEEEYVLYEDEAFQRHKYNIGPNSLNLKQDEVNLRSYRILGGIYILNYLDRPLQTQVYPNLILTLQQQPDILTYRNYNETKNERFVEIKLKLPENIFWAKTPLVCRWYPWNESNEFLNLPKDVQNYQLNYEQIMEEERQKLFSVPSPNIKNIPIKIMKDFNLSNIPKEINRYDLTVDYILPRLPNNYKFSNEKLDDFLAEEKIRKKRLQVLREEEAEAMIKKNILEKRIQEIQEKFIDDEGNLTEEGTKAINELKQETKEKRIEIVENTSLTKIIEKTGPRELFPSPQRQIRPLIIKESGIKYERKINDVEDENLRISEFLEKLKQTRESCFPIFKDSNKTEKSSTKMHRQKSSRISIKTTRHSLKFVKKSRIDGFEKLGDSNLNEIKNKVQKRKGKYPLIEHASGHWSISGIQIINYDQDSRTITFKTGQFGIFGFAAFRYTHFPYKFWELKPNTDMSASLIIKCELIEIEICIRYDGYILNVIQPKEVDRTFIVPSEPLSLKELINFLREKNLNIFPDLDASSYISIDLFSEKHSAMEIHSYLSIGTYCLTHNFISSPWNKFSQRRVAILKCRQIIDDCPIKEFAEIMITPLKSLFVEIEELCTDLDIIELNYIETPKDQEFSPDLYSLLSNNSVKPSKQKQANTKNSLRYNCSEILKAIRPLSFS